MIGNCRVLLHSSVHIVLALVVAIGGWYYGIHVASRGFASRGYIIAPPNVDLIAPWFGTREIVLHRRSPYSSEVTGEIQLAVYGTRVGKDIDQQQFAYPVFSALLFLPFALLPLAVAEKSALICLAILTTASVVWWSGQLSIRNWTLATLLTAGSFPLFYALRGLQPGLLVAGILAASFAAARSDRLALSGILLATATSKPHLAIAVALALGMWALNDLRLRKALVLSFLGSLGILMAVSQILIPGWFIKWISVLRAYTQYSKATPLVFYAGSYAGTLFIVLLLSSIAFVTWTYREDLPFATAYCVAAFFLMIPFHIYDEVILLAPISWLVINRHLLQGWTSRMLLASVKVILCLAWFSTTAIALLDLISHSAAHVVWNFPFGLAGVLPLAVYLALCHSAFSAQRFRGAADWNASFPNQKAAQLPIRPRSTIAGGIGAS